MAKGKKTGGRNFAPGNTYGIGNHRVPEDLRGVRSLNRHEFERLLNEMIRLDGFDLQDIIRDKRVPIMKRIVAQILDKAFNYGDTRRMEFVLDRLIGKPTVQPDQSSQAFTPTQKKTFEEFCATAGYPTPYPKQVEMMKFGFEETDTRLLLGARGYGKTDYVTICGTAYDIYLNGTNTSNLIISKSKTRNTAIIEEIAHCLTRNGIKLEKENCNVLRVEGMQGSHHSCEVLTIKSTFRGRHPKRIIMDDPVTEEDVSEAMRTLVKRKYNEAMKLSKNILVLGQPAHPFDLYAELRPILKKLEFAHGSIPELDVDIRSMELCGVDINSILMSYKLIVPQGSASSFANLKFTDKFPERDSVAFLDPSDGGDYTAITCMCGFMQAMAAYGRCWKRSWYDAIDEIVPIIKARKVRQLWFETNSTGRQPIIQLKQLLAGTGCEVIGVHSDTNKHACIESAGSYSHLIHLSKESDKVYTDMVVKYEKGVKYDDAPDSLARCLERIGLIKGKK